MPNSDQLKYLKREPKPITYPLPPKPYTLTREDVQRIVFEKVSEILYNLLRSEEEISISTMSFADFDAFLQRVMCTNEEEEI